MQDGNVQIRPICARSRGKTKREVELVLQVGPCRTAQRSQSHASEIARARQLNNSVPGRTNAAIVSVEEGEAVTYRLRQEEQSGE